MLAAYFTKLNLGLPRRVDALGFAFFRVAYAAVLLLELRQLFFFQALIFPEGPLPANLVFGLLVVWAMALCFLMAGWFTRLAAGINYLVSVAVVWGMPDFKYHLDFIMIGVNFLLLWLPVSATFSLDADWRGRKTGQRAPVFVDGSWLALPVVLALGLVYLDSFVHKLSSQIWMSGLGFWLPSSLPQNAQTDLSWILNQEGLVKTIGYGIMVFEGLFLPLVWWRPLRPYLVGAGLLLHAGIGLAYPIPHFSLMMMALYLPLLPEGWWRGLRRAGSWFWHQTGKAGARPVRRPADLPEAGRDRWAGWRKAFLLYCCGGQLLCLTASPLFEAGARQVGMEKHLLLLQQAFKPVFFLNQKFLGLVSHDIFLDKHFLGYQQLLSLRYVPDRGPALSLPLLDEQGQPGSYCRGRLWTKWVYRLNNPGADQQKQAAGREKFASFWAASQQLPLAGAVFQVMVKEVEVPLRWQRDHLRKQMRRPWRPAGTLRLKAGETGL
ncbi:MAG: hypothetical protein ACO1NZ_15885 [Adhaeribacter sp.]